jgi:hypothetical protein
MPDIYIRDRQRDSPADENRREGVIAVAKVMANASALSVAYKNFIDAKAFFSMGLAGQKLGYCRRSALVVGVAPAFPGGPHLVVNPDAVTIDNIRRGDPLDEFSRNTSFFMDLKYLF